jgi:hypothetical protein
VVIPQPIVVLLVRTMIRYLFIVLLRLLGGGFDSPAQTLNADLSTHILWEVELPNLHASSLSTAVVDKNGDLWFVTDFPESSRLVHLTSNGKLVSAKEFPTSLGPRPPAEVSTYALAVLPSGAIGILAHYNHANGKAIYFDGAAFARVDAEEVGIPKDIAGTGPEYKGFLALNDEHFLVMGDQSPLVLIRIDARGRKTWQRRFPSSWVLPSGAALENGQSCIVSPEYGAPRLHLVQLDSSGSIQHRAEISARRGLATSGPDGSCVILYDRGRELQRYDFFLADYDASFTRQWTVPVQFDRPWGGTFHLVRTSDGYLVVAEATQVPGPLFIGKYDPSGRLLWSLVEKSRRAPSLVAAQGEAFYLVGAGLDGHDSLSVIRGH